MKRAIGTLVLGLVLVVAGVVAWKVNNNAAASALAGLTVPPSTPGLAATATGTGGANPTAVLAASRHLTPAEGVGTVPTTPVLYLPPAQLQSAGVNTGTEAAYWKVWWDGSGQTEAVISLQQHLDENSAQSAAAQLVSQMSKPSSFQMTQVSTFTLPEVPGGSGYVWQAAAGTDKAPVPVEMRFITFYAGSRVALLSMTTYGHKTDAAAFESFATAEYNKLNAAGDPLSSNYKDIADKYFELWLIGAALLVIGTIQLLFQLRRRRRGRSY